MVFLKEVDFKETSIGKIPKGWSTKKLEDVIDSCENGIWGDDPSPKDDSYPVIRSTEITHDGRIDLSTVVQRKIPNEKLGKYSLQNGDILIVASSGSAHLIGRAALFTNPSSRKYLFSNFMIRIHPNGIDPWFLHHLLKSKKYYRFLKSLQQTSTGLRNLPKKEFLQFTVPFPPLEEQKVIVGFLSVVDLAIAKTGEVIAKTERLKKGLMQELLTRGIGHKEHKQTPIGKIPEEWEVTNIDDECLVGTGGTPSRSNPQYFGGNISWVKSTEVNYNIITKTEETLSEFGMQNSNAKTYPKGSLIVALYGQGITRGKCAILGIDAAVNQACAALQSKGRVYVPFLFYWFQNSYANIRRLSQGANQANLNMEIIRSLKIPLPSILEQQKIARMLSTFDEKLELEGNEKAKLERVKQGLMDLLLTGKIRVGVN